jgi:hypothetical protein
MPVAYLLQPPDPRTNFPVTLVLSGRRLVKKGTLIPTVREYASETEARSHLDGTIRDYERVGYRVAGPDEVEEEILPEQLWGLTVAFDVATKRMTMVIDEEPTAEMLDTIAARLRAYEPRCLHVVAEWLLPKWDDPRHVPELEKALDPSLAAFIFDSPGHTIARQSYSTLGDISDVLAACPNLNRAFITGRSTMRTTRHESLRELYLLGSPLDPSVLPGLAGSQFPALERLVLEQLEHEYLSAADLAQSLRSMDAPRLSHVYVDGVRLLELLPIIGAAALPWNLCLIERHFDEVDELVEILAQHEALRSGKLRLDLDKLFDSEIAQLRELGVTVEDMSDVFAPRYSTW